MNSLPPDDRDDPDEVMAARHSRMLAELADIAMQLARAAGRKALVQVEMDETQADPRGDGGQGDAGLAFTRIARCVRQTLALEARLVQARRARADGVGGLPAFWRPPEGAVEALHERLARIMADDDEEDEASGDPSDREDLLVDLHERLNDKDGAGLACRPTGDRGAGVRRDLDRFSDIGGESEPPAAIARRAASPHPDPWPHRAAGKERAMPPGRGAEPP